MAASPTALPGDSLVSPSDQPSRPAATPGLSALGERFLARLPPMPMPAGAIGEPYLIGFPPDAVASLGISHVELDTATGLTVFTGDAVVTWSDPLATIYSGHQFGVWAGQLGDGHALLLAEFRTAGSPYEVQLKGAGRTPYSRTGDGRAVL